jgi:hypothetical protein
MEKKMNSVDKFVFQSMLAYPSIFPTREAVLDHALFVIGNAIPWHHGELVSDRPHFTVEAGLAGIDDALKKDRERIDEIMSGNEDKDYMKDMATEMYTAATARREVEREVVRNAENLAVIKCPVGAVKVGHYGSNFYVYSNIYNIPDDVTPEWLEACYEIAEWAKAENPHYDEIIAHLSTITEKLKNE